MQSSTSFVISFIHVGLAGDQLIYSSHITALTPKILFYHSFAVCVFRCQCIGTATLYYRQYFHVLNVFYHVLLVFVDTGE